MKGKCCFVPKKISIVEPLCLTQRSRSMMVNNEIEYQLRKTFNNQLHLQLHSIKLQSINKLPKIHSMQHSESEVTPIKGNIIRVIGYNSASAKTKKLPTIIINNQGNRNADLLSSNTMEPNSERFYFPSRSLIKPIIYFTRSPRKNELKGIELNNAMKEYKNEFPIRVKNESAAKNLQNHAKDHAVPFINTFYHFRKYYNSQ